MARWVVFRAVFVAGALGASGGGCHERDPRGRLPDARLADAPPDMGSEEQPRPVQVTVTVNGRAASDLTVYFQQPDMTLVADAKTDVYGQARAVVRDGGFVTVVQPVGFAPPFALPLTTYASVKQGDDLRLDLAGPPPLPTVTLVTFDLTFTDEQLGHRYQLFSSCGQVELGVGPSPPRAGRTARRAAAVATLTQSVTLTNCGGTADLLLISSDDQTGELLGWQYRAATPVVDGMPVAMTDDYQVPTSVAFHYTDVPVMSNGFQIRRQLRASNGRALFIARTPAPVAPDTDAHTVTATLILPGPANLPQITETDDLPSTGSSRASVVEWGPGGDYALDWGQTVLRGYATVASVDLASHAIVWTETANGLAPEFVLGIYRATRSDGDAVKIWDWRIIAPYTAPKLVYPTVPTTIYNFNPMEGDAAPAILQLTTVRAFGGYDIARPHAFESGGFPRILGPSGKAIIENGSNRP